MSRLLPMQASGGCRGIGSLSAPYEDVEWFRTTFATVPRALQSKLVFHRGFHDTKDLVSRPIENTLAAYEQAWAGGAAHCECDIALTADGHIVLCHDANFARVALHPTSAVAQTPTNELTLAEIMSLPLRDGSRPPLLIEVLRSAQVLDASSANGAKLVVEIKKGNPECCRALCEFFAQQPELIHLVSVVMSFEYSIAHLFADEFARARDAYTRARRADADADADADAHGTVTDGAGAGAPSPARKRRKSSSGDVEENGELLWRRPKIMFLTTARPNNCEVERCLSVNLGLGGGQLDDGGEFAAQVEAYLDGTAAAEKERVEEVAGEGEAKGGAAALRAEPRNDTLDGIYMQYQDAMVLPGAARDRFVELCRTHTVGVWMSAATDPDSLAVVAQLAEVGAAFINTDMARSFDIDAHGDAPTQPPVDMSVPVMG